MRSVLSIWLLFAFSSLAHANPVTVRTGEHADFTRVVLFLGDGVSWTFEQTLEGYRLTADVEDGFDLSEFYALIPKTRISAVQQRIEAGQLDFSVSCPCNGTSLQYRPGVVVIDIADEVAEPTLEAVVSDMRLVQIPNRMTGLFSVPANAVIPLFPETTMIVPPMRAPISVDDTTKFPPPTIESVERLDELEGRISVALSQGLATGLLNIREESNTSAVSHDIGDLAEFTDIPGITARTSVDVRTGWADPGGTVDQSGRACLPDAFFDIQSWGDTRPFGSQIGEMRAALSGEFDKPEAESALRLAQRFVYFGFGQEALQALGLKSAQSLQRRSLADIARIIDGRDLDPSPYTGQVSCPSTVALWALLATEGENLDGAVATESILFRFKDLPRNIQTIIAPRLSNAFVRLGQTDASRQVMARADGPISDISLNAIAQSDLAVAERETKRAVELLERGIEDAGRTNPASLIRLFEMGISAGRVFNDADFALADAVRFEARGSEEFLLLSEAQLQAYLSMAQFTEAQEILAELAPLISDQQDAAFKDRFAREAVVGMSDADFGEFAWSDERLPFDEGTRAAMADRLVQMGFPERARQIGLTDNVTPTGNARQIQADRASAVMAGPMQGVQRSLAGSSNLSASEAEGRLEEAEITGPISLRGGQDLLARSALLRDELKSRLDAVSIGNGAE